MTVAVLLAVGGLGLLAIGVLLLRSIGPRFRIGRLLAAAPLVSVDEALEIARAHEPGYVRVAGRLSSEEEFPDDQNRPLVYRRTRIQVREPNGAWTAILDEREGVEFGIETRQSFIAVDDTALADGLIVIPRVSAGRVRDLPTDLRGDLPIGTDPDVDAQLTIEQLSAVEHATVVGQPAIREGREMLTSGMGRPLIVTALDQPAAMRVLARDSRPRVVMATIALALGLGLLAFAGVAFVTGV